MEVKKYTRETIDGYIRPLSQNAFISFFQKIGRGWLSLWYSFSDRHEKAASLIYKIFFFIVFSESVTIFQFLVMTFLPKAFTALGTEAWGWPNIPLKIADNVPYIIFGDAKGLGYFIAFEIAVFLAQCINFPLQRNITYRSHGNVWFQAMWYFIGWILISLFVNAVWGFVNCFMVAWKWSDAIAGLIKTFITGGISMVIFFFIFMIIFPDAESAVKKSEAKLHKLVKNNADGAAIAKEKQKLQNFKSIAERTRLEKNLYQSSALAGAKALRYETLLRKNEKRTDGKLSDDKIDIYYTEAVNAIIAKEQATEEYAVLFPNVNANK